MIGRIPELAVISAVGVLLIALANSAGRQQLPWAMLLFLSGLLLIVGPTGYRLLQHRVRRGERAGLLLLLTISLYTIKVLHSPLQFTFADEFQHIRTANDILASGHLFTPNPLSHVSPQYPALEIVVNALVTVTGLTVFQAGVLLIGLARILLTLSLYSLYGLLLRSYYWASVGTVIYMANFNYVFWSAQFAYESLALPVAVFVLYLIVGRVRVDQPQLSLPLTCLGLLGTVALLTIHHVTMYWFVAFLAVWLVISLRPAWLSARYFRMSITNALGLSSLGLIILLVILAIVGLASTGTLTYLGYSIRDGAADILKAALGNLNLRTPYEGFVDGLNAPLFERLTAFSAVGLVMFGLLISIPNVWQRHRHEPLLWVFALGATIYPLSLPLRLFPNGWDLANRTSEFVFVLLGLLLALALRTGVLWIGPPLRHFAAAASVSRLRTALILLIILILLAGGLNSGWPYWERLPGPFLVSADARSISTESLAAARWMRQYLGPNRLVLTDRVNEFLMGAYGQQQMVNYGTTNIYVSPILLNPTFDASTVDALRRSQTQFVAIDKRLTTQLPVIGYYVEIGEPDGMHHRQRLSTDAVNKFDNVPGAGRIYDNGPLIIYDVRQFHDLP